MIAVKTNLHLDFRLIKYTGHTRLQVRPRSHIPARYIPTRQDSCEEVHDAHRQELRPTVREQRQLLTPNPNWGPGMGRCRIKSTNRGDSSDPNSPNFR